MRRKFYNLICSLLLVATTVMPAYCTQSTTKLNETEMLGDLYTLISTQDEKATYAEPVMLSYHLAYQVQSNSQTSDQWEYNDVLFINGTPVTRYYWEVTKGPHKGSVFTQNGEDYIISSDSNSSFTITASELSTYVDEKYMKDKKSSDTYTVTLYPFVTPKDYADNVTDKTPAPKG